MLFATNEIVDSNNKNKSGEIKSQSQASTSENILIYVCECVNRYQ